MPQFSNLLKPLLDTEGQFLTLHTQNEAVHSFLSALILLRYVLFLSCWENNKAQFQIQALSR